MVRAQVLAWARLPALAALGRADDADATLAQAAAALEADPAGQASGRFGFDIAEFDLHAAEAHLLLARPGRVVRHAAASAAACRTGSPGWAAAVVLARTHAADAPGDAATLALGVLDRIPAERLRSTTRTRLAALAPPCRAWTSPTSAPCTTASTRSRHPSTSTGGPRQHSQPTTTGRQQASSRRAAGSRSR